MILFKSQRKITLQLLKKFAYSITQVQSIKITIIYLNHLLTNSRLQQTRQSQFILSTLFLFISLKY